MFVRKLKQLGRDFGRWFGLEIRMNGINARDDLRLVHFLEMHKIDVLIDVGANAGQFGTELLSAGYRGSIVSFEPVPEAYEALKKLAATYGVRWTVAPRVALSDTSGTTKFFVTEANVCSSMLRPAAMMIEATPATKVKECIVAPTERLDAFASELRLAERRPFLKLDVQGAEAAVLAGAPETLKHVKGILVELSLTELYEGQSSAESVHQRITDLGFELWDLWRGYRNPQTSRLNQIDALYFSP